MSNSLSLYNTYIKYTMSSNIIYLIFVTGEFNMYIFLIHEFVSIKISKVFIYIYNKRLFLTFKCESSK